MKATTIEELVVEKTFYRREKDAFGNTYREPYTKKIKRKVTIVDAGPRFGYYLIDSVLILVLQVLFAVLLLFVLRDTMYVNLVINLFSALLFFGYYFLFEFLMQQTPGKMVLGYFVIGEQAQSPPLTDCIVRTLARFIPFEAFSCLSEKGGWHDRFSKTYVVSKKERDALQKLMGNAIQPSAELLDQ